MKWTILTLIVYALIGCGKDEPFINEVKCDSVEPARCDCDIIGFRCIDSPPFAGTDTTICEPYGGFQNWLCAEKK